jgi:hypothetical protein
MNIGLDIVENNNFFLCLSGFITERGQLLVTSIDEVVKVRPDMLFALAFEGLIRLTYILIEIEIIGIDNQDLRVDLDLLQYKIFNLF